MTYPNVELETLSSKWSELASFDQKDLKQVEIEARYSSYLERQASDIAMLRKDEKRAIPADIDYRQVGSLSNEIREKLIMSRPETIAQAQRIEGMTPSAILAVLAHMRKREMSEDLRQAGTVE